MAPKDSIRGFPMIRIWLPTTLNTPLIEMGIIMSVGIKKQRHYTSISYMLHEE
jgi:hypothetical protein